MRPRRPVFQPTGRNRTGGPRIQAIRALFGVTLRSQPGDLAVARQPLVDLGLGGEAGDVANVRSRTMGLDLPFAFGDSLRGESDAGRFFHAGYMALNRVDS
jgi:hypothetical protein